MTLLFFEGFQNFTTAARPEWVGNSANGASPGTGRDGTAQGAIISNSNAVPALSIPTAPSPLILGVAFSVSGLGSIRNWNFRDTNNTQQLTIVTSTSGFLEVRKGGSAGTLLGTTSGHNPLGTNEWRYIEHRVVLDPTNGSVVIALDGVVVLNLTGVSTSTTASGVAYYYPYQTNGGTTIDDLYVLDTVDATATQGRPFNAFLGDVSVKAALPTGPGDATQWTPSTAVANYTTVDENPPNTTDYVQTAVAGNRDLYVMEDLPPTAAVAFAVQAVAYAQKTDSGAAAIKPIVKDGSVVSDGARAAQPLSTTYATYGSGIITKKPSDGTLLTVAAVNAMQAGVESG